MKATTFPTNDPRVTKGFIDINLTKEEAKALLEEKVPKSMLWNTGWLSVLYPLEGVNLPSWSPKEANF